MLIDSNVLIGAVDEGSKFHHQVKTWLESALNGNARVAIPWDSIGAFLRIVTSPRIFDNPLTVADALSYVDDWLAAKASWIPVTNMATFKFLRDVVETTQSSGNLIPDALLASICLEHNMPIVTLDSDFDLFDVEVIDPSKVDI